jgi:hypothetical protein
VVLVAGEVDLADAPGGQGVDVAAAVEAMVAGADVDVVHVEQQPAVGALGQFG